MRDATEVIAAAIDEDAVFIDTDGFRSIRMNSPKRYAELALDALRAAGYQVVRIDGEDLWDAQQCVQDWRGADNCDDTPANRKRLAALAKRLRDAANAIAAEVSP